VGAIKYKNQKPGAHAQRAPQVFALGFNYVAPHHWEKIECCLHVWAALYFLFDKFGIKGGAIVFL
jgi:hypothetical protein